MYNGMILKTVNGILMMTAVLTTLAAQEIDIQGKVVDDALRPISGAKVKLKQNDIEVLTNDDGTFHLTGNTLHGIDRPFFSPSNFVGLRKNRLEFGNYKKVEVSILSIRGEILSRHVFKNKNGLPMSSIIPSSIHSKAIIIIIRTEKETYAFRAIKCGFRWLGKGIYVPETRRINGTFSAATVILDTLRVKKKGYETYKEPLASLLTKVNDIVLVAEQKEIPSLIGGVSFSESSKTFKGQLSVAMSATIDQAEIRYTTDGTVPTATSTLYSTTPLMITSTTQLRAQAFQEGEAIGDMSTAIYILRTFDFTSNIPIVVMEGYGGGKPVDKENFIDLAFFTFDTISGVASLENEPTLAARAGYHLRGQSSKDFEKSPYRVELWDNNDNDADYPVLGMPEESDWAMIGPYVEKTLIRNALVYTLGRDIGLPAMQVRFAEVYINQDDSPLEPGDYQGVYTVVQTIKNQKSRLDLKQLKEDDTDPEKLSGGYIFKFDQMAVEVGETELECVGADKMAGSFNFGGFNKLHASEPPGNAKQLAGGIPNFGGRTDSTATCWDDLELVDPSPANEQQIAWITNYIQNIHDILHADPIGNWMEYIDLPSFVNLFLINEFSRDVDAYIRSHFMYKERGEPMIKCGPLWDYNFTFGALSSDTEGWHWEENRRGTNDWYLILWKQPEFINAAAIRWKELRGSTFSEASITQYINSISSPLSNAAHRDIEKWPIKEIDGILTIFSDGHEEPKTWELQIEYMKTFAKDRLLWLDSAFNAIEKQ